MWPRLIVSQNCVSGAQLPLRTDAWSSLNWTTGYVRGAAAEMADDTSSLSILSRRPFWWFVIGPAGAVGSIWGKRLGEARPLLGHIVFILGLVLIAIGHGWAIDWAYVRLAGHHRHHQRSA